MFRGRERREEEKGSDAAGARTLEELLFGPQATRRADASGPVR